MGVMEDEGLEQDHTSGLAATDGTWRHIAVTWESSTGNTVMYDNGRRVRSEASAACTCMWLGIWPSLPFPAAAVPGNAT